MKLKFSGNLVRITCFFVITGVFSDIFAQELIPDSVQPGRLEQEFKTLRVPKSNAKAFIPGQKDLVAPKGAEDLIFILKKINFEGVTALDVDALSDEFKGFINKKVSLVNLYTIANRTTSVYRNMGYVLSQAVVPEQEINEDGVVTIKVVEGYINKISVKGIKDQKKQQRILKATEKIRQSRPLNTSDLERQLLILNDFGGVDFSATLSPSDAVGAADMLLSVTKTQFNASLNLENRGTDIVGPERLTGQLAVNDVLGAFDSNNLTFISTGNDELSFLSVNNEVPIGVNGWNLANSLSFSKSEPGGQLEILEIESDTTTFASTVEFPLIRSRIKNLSLRGGFEVYNSESTRLASAEGSELLATEDKLRSLRIGLVFDNIDRFRGVNLVDLELSKGLNIFGASELGDARLSREFGDPEYTKLSFYAARLQSIMPRWSALFSISGQFTNDNLLSSEQFGIGGKNFGSAFDSSEIIGD